MAFNQCSFYSKFRFSFQKFANEEVTISLPNTDIFYDNSDFIWNSSSNALDYCWLTFFEKYGTNLQNMGNSQNEFQKPYSDYLKNAVTSILSNKIDGLVKVDSYEEKAEHWTFSTSVPPSTLLNCLRYTPWRIVDKEVISSFIIYQIICAIEDLHLLNVPHLRLTLDNVFIDENFIVKLSPPHLDTLTERITEAPSDQEPNLAKHTQSPQTLDHVLWEWMCGEMSNLDYLLYLNKLAGRSLEDPNNHPMIPWVTDFSQPYGGFRDLKISKFRINKGDEHLDKIYQDQKDELQQYDSSCPLGHSDIHKKHSHSSKSRITKQSSLVTPENDGPFNPHHVSDILSELSYYAYMARVTSIDILKKCYRSFYNPQEFRWDMAKMYAWSPDECIPQFFTDPSVFRSTHSDMPDIGLPDWCKDPEEFVKYHREILESDEVSEELNHWIDLIFGYKLLGNEAVMSKNVHRQFTEKTLSLTNNGLSVLFRRPHPRRLCNSRTLMTYFGPMRPKSNYSDLPSQSSGHLICLPEDYDPCELVEYYKIYSSFIQDSCATSAVELLPVTKRLEPILRLSLKDDVLSLCCLIVELYNADKLRSDYLLSHSEFDLRLDSCCQLFSEEPSRIPLAFRDTVEKMLLYSSKKTIYIPNIFELKRSQKWIVFDRSIVDIFDLTKHIQSPLMDTVIAVKHFFLTQSDAAKYSLETLTIITPHLIYLLNLDLDIYFDEVLEIMVCILHRFGLMAGRNILIRDILPHIIKLYPKSKNLVKSRHALLYQRNFLNLLLIRIGMDAFLSNMVGLLVHMLVIGQHIFGSMKESVTPEMECKQNEQDTESLNEEDRFICRHDPFGDDDNSIQDSRRQIIDCFDEDCQSVDMIFATQDSDSVSQSGIEIEETKYPVATTNGCIPNSLPNLLDLLPLSDQENIENTGQLNKSKNGSLTKLLSPFKKRQNNKATKKITSKVEMRKYLSQDCSKMSLAQLSYSSLIWLSDLIGPIEASSKILSELLAQFSSCYLNCKFDEVPPESLDESCCSLVTGTYDSFVQADQDVITVLECLRDFIGLYGLAIVWHQIRHFLDTLLDKSIFIREDMLPDTLASLVCSLSLLRFLSMLIPNEYLDVFLSGKVLDEYLPLIIRTIGNMSQPFPNGRRPRQVLLHKVIDLIYLLSCRLKFDQIKDNMNNIYNLLFGLFSKTFDCNSQGVIIYRDVPIDVIEPVAKENDSAQFVVNYLPENNAFTVLTSKTNLNADIQRENVRVYRTISTSNRELAFEEMKSVITAELAYVLYISFAKLFGQNKLDSLICNHTLIQALMAHHEHQLNNSSYSTPDKAKHHKLEESINFLTKSVMAHCGRHLKDLWKEYWVHELGFCDSEQFDIKQMRLGKFEGHNGAVKGFDVLNCENGFLSYAKDKVVKLFSIANIDFDNIATEVPSTFSYIHQKQVSEAMFIEQMRMAVSLDGSVHLWDPFIGKKIITTSLNMTNPNWSVLCSIPPSQSTIAVSNIDGRVHIVDLRSGISTYCYYLNASIITSPTSSDFPSNTGGFIKQISATSDGKHLILGNSDGSLNMLDLRANKVVNTWRPHQSEISQIVFMKNWCISSSVEPTGRVSLVNLSNLSQSHTLHGSDLGSIHSLMVHRNQIVVGASQNRFGMFQGLSQYTSLNRLSPTLYKGTVSSASLLLHNRLLLLGNDTGGISLWY